MVACQFQILSDFSYTFAAYPSRTLNSGGSTESFSEALTSSASSISIIDSFSLQAYLGHIVTSSFGSPSYHLRHGHSLSRLQIHFQKRIRLNRLDGLFLDGEKKSR